ncbi:translation initiation factor eIF4e, partial [Lophium mytilinum]
MLLFSITSIEPSLPGIPEYIFCVLLPFSFSLPSFPSSIFTDLFLSLHAQPSQILQSSSQLSPQYPHAKLTIMLYQSQIILSQDAQALINLYNTQVAYFTKLARKMSQHRGLSLTTSSLPTLSETDAAATSSPARGKETRLNLQKVLRPPPLVHTWVFYHDRQDRKPSSTDATSAATPSTTTPSYEARLVQLAQMNDIKEFWSVLNNFDIAALEKKDSIHLFHKGVKPLWEDPRNLRGGSWTFKVQKTHGAEFWKELCLLAVGEQLQNAVATDRKTFLDDICGISLTVKWTHLQICIWNRDAEHAAGIAKIREVVDANITEALMPKSPDAVYYKAHSAHEGFREATAGAAGA